jgi:hypothetical protein
MKRHRRALGAEAFKAVFAFHMKKYIKKKGFCGAGKFATTKSIFQMWVDSNHMYPKIKNGI